eukprot:UN09346
MASEGCTDFEIVVYVYSVLGGLLFLSSVPILYKYITNPDKPPNLILYSGLIFIIFNISTILVTIMMLAEGGVCGSGEENKKLEPIFGALYMFCYLSQTYMLSLTSYIRLHFIFIGTQFELSKCTVLSYRSVFVILPLFGILIISLQNGSTKAFAGFLT